MAMEITIDNSNMTLGSKLQILHGSIVSQFPAIPRRDLSTKKTKPYVEKWPEILGVMLEF